MTKALSVKTIFISILFILSSIVAKAQSSFTIKNVICNENAIEILICNATDSIVKIPKFSLRITAFERCNIKFWNIQEDTLFLTFSSTIPSCLQGDFFASEMKYRDVALKPGKCCKQTLVLDRKIMFKYLIFSYDGNIFSFKK